MKSRSLASQATPGAYYAERAWAESTIRPVTKAGSADAPGVRVVARELLENTMASSRSSQTSVPGISALSLGGNDRRIRGAF